MKKLILRNGLYSSGVLIGLGVIPLLFLGIPGPEDYKRGEIIGYASIVLAMIFVFFGIRQYRDQENDGLLNFWEAMKVGLAIAAFPAIAFGIYNLIYVEFLDPEFIDKYFSYGLDQAKTNMSVEQFKLYRQEMENQKEMFMNPLMQFFIMFLTVFIIGFIVSFISAFILKKTPEVETG